jgi:hypothetical protein
LRAAQALAGVEQRSDLLGVAAGKLVHDPHRNARLP